MKGFNHLQLISIKNAIFNVPLNIFLFNNWKKLECLQISKFLRFKIIWTRSLQKLVGGSNFVQKLGPSYKKRRLCTFYWYFWTFIYSWASCISLKYILKFMNYIIRFVIHLLEGDNWILIYICNSNK